MRPLLYSINVTLDGCVHHNAVPADDALLQEQLLTTHRHATETIARADALLFGRTTYEMMEGAWRLAARTTPPADWQMPFARTIDAMKKYVVSSTLGQVDWNAELVTGNLGEAVRKLKQQPGKALFTGGALAYRRMQKAKPGTRAKPVMQPRIAGHGPTLFAGLSRYVELKLIDRKELSSGAVALRYKPRR